MHVSLRVLVTIDIQLKLAFDDALDVGQGLY